MIYSTLKEVYDVDTFEKKKKKKCVDDYSDNGDEVLSKDSKSGKKNKDLYLQSTPTQCAAAPSRKHSMNNVKPFLDDELEHYFNFNDYQNTVPKPAVVAEPAVAAPVASAAPVAPTVAVSVVSPSKETQKASKKDVYYKNLINIGLFVFIGILIIFLCDQITEIAINIGMKRTVAILEPYLARLEKLQEQNKI